VGLATGVCGCNLLATFDPSRLTQSDATIVFDADDAGVWDEDALKVIDADVETDAGTDAEIEASVAPDAADGDVATDHTDGGEDAGLPPLGVGVITMAGSSEHGALDGLRDAARFWNPVNVAFGPDGNVYVADYDNNLVRTIDPDGRVRTLVRQAGFEHPFGLAFAPDGTLYVETDVNDLGERSTMTGTLWRVGRDGRATALARDLGRPRGMVVLGDGRLFLADPEHHVVRIYDPVNNRTVDLAGEYDSPGFADGEGSSARFNAPVDVARVGDAVIVADRENHRLRAVTLDGRVTTFAGGAASGAVDGDRMSARFMRPYALASDGAGNLFVTDLDSYVLRRVSADGVVTTFAGDGRSGFADALEPRQAQFFGLEGMDVSPDGSTLYVADGNRGGTGDYHRVRRIRRGL
jgi:DNA-binding beta-propeller fold protein YncE